MLDTRYWILVQQAVAGCELDAFPGLSEIRRPYCGIPWRNAGLDPASSQFRPAQPFGTKNHRVDHGSAELTEVRIDPQLLQRIMPTDPQIRTKTFPLHEPCREESTVLGHLSDNVALRFDLRTCGKSPLTPLCMDRGQGLHPLQKGRTKKPPPLKRGIEGDFQNHLRRVPPYDKRVCLYLGAMKVETQAGSRVKPGMTVLGSGMTVLGPGRWCWCRDAHLV